MATTVVKRPKLTLGEKMYLPSILKGLAITVKHVVRMLTGKTRVVMQYPEEKWDEHLPAYYRGVPALGDRRAGPGTLRGLPVV